MLFNIHKAFIKIFRKELFILCVTLNSECKLGHFGMACKETCSDQCLNSETCDHVSGVCSSGCQDGYLGIYCNNCKKLTSLFVKVTFYKL